MSNAAFDTLTVARKLKAAGVEAELADAIVEAMKRSTEKFVTVEHFDAAVERLDNRIDGLEARIDAVRTELLARIDAVRSELLARIDGLEARIDSVRTEMQASIARFHPDCGGSHDRCQRADVYDPRFRLDSARRHVNLS